MALASPVRRALIGAAIAAAVAGAVAWTGSPLLVVAAAALSGALAGWLVDRCLYRPLRSLRERLDRGEAAAATTSRVAGARHLAAAIDGRLGELRERIREIEGERGDLREILESMTDGVVVADGDARIRHLNPAFAELFAAHGARPGQTVLEMSRSPDLVSFLERLEDEAGLATARVESEAGRVLELRGRLLAQGRKVVLARDLTDQQRLDETRRDLVANVSHELRTPLTAIRGYAENLRDGAITEPATAARFVERILAQCGRLETLLEDLLALARLESDQPIPLAAGLDLGALAERSLETVRGLAAERRVELGSRLAPVPAIAGNEETLERLLLNLLENAIKYNRPGGSVTVGLDHRGDEVVLEVADSGIGVPRRDLRRIFERFYRVDRGRSREEGGTGLGLAIVKHAAQLHGGRVEVESDLGRGTTFRIHLPAPA